MPSLQKTTKLLLDAVLPVANPTGQLAAEAYSWSRDKPSTYCPRCGVTVNPTAVTETGCPHCRSKRLPWANLYRLGAYQTPLSNWILDLKFHHRWPWADYLGQQLAQVTQSAPVDG
ncbi:MAG: hypothetical protein ACYTGQ_01730, partial [Planctomycetota bacterium]